MSIKAWFIKPSTEAFIKAARNVPGYSFFDLLHGYIYGRWTYLYIGLGTGEHRLARFYARVGEWLKRGVVTQKKEEAATGALGFADTYHGKAVPLETATRLVRVDEPVNIPDLEQVIPYKRARALIMEHPDHIIALNCPCRTARANPCLPLDVCLVVGEPFASFVNEHHPDKSRWITQDEAAAILKAEDERGHVHHVFFKDAMLGRFYAICNCCSCCCGAMQAQRNGTPMLCSSGYVSEVDESMCIGCETCVDYCQFGALAIVEGINTVDHEKCMGCGVCVNQCANNAMFLRRDESKGEPLEIFNLMEQAAS